MVKVPIKIRKVIDAYISDISSICPIEKVFLFGSYASGRVSEGSDIDLAIFSKKINFFL